MFTNYPKWAMSGSVSVSTLCCVVWFHHVILCPCVSTLCLFPPSLIPYQSDNTIPCITVTFHHVVYLNILNVFQLAWMSEMGMMLQLICYRSTYKVGKQDSHVYKSNSDICVVASCTFAHFLDNTQYCLRGCEDPFQVQNLI